MTTEIRNFRPEDREQGFALRVQAFSPTHEPYDPDEAYLPDERRLGWFEDGRLVGALGVWDVGQWFGGRCVPCGGVGGVVVAPDARRRGVATDLLARSLDEMRDRGEVISALYPMTAAPYRRFGWEFAGEHVHRRVPTRALATLPPAPDDVTVRPAGREAAAASAPVFAEVAARHDGNLARSEVFQARRFDLEDGDYAYVAERDGTTIGVLVYHHARSDDPAAVYDLRVDELVGLDGAAELALWRVLASSTPAAADVGFVSRPADPLLLLLAEDELRAPPRAWHWMLRLVDAPAAVAARGYRQGARATVELEIADARAPWNAGRFVLEVEDGEGRLTPGGAGRVGVDIGTLSAIYTGWARPADLLAIGRLAGATVADVRALSDVFGGPTPWMREFF